MSGLEVFTPDAAFAEESAERAVDLIWATGASSYDYQFGPGRDLFDLFVGAAWTRPRTLFSHSEATVTTEDGELVGLEIGYSGRDWYGLKEPLRAISKDLLEEGRTSIERLREMGKRSHQASYLNAFVPESAYYVLALSVSESQRGRGLGRRLLERAIESARREGYRELQLDVLSDNPAVDFYRAMGLECVAETVAPEPCREHGVPMEMRMVRSLR